MTSNSQGQYFIVKTSFAVARYKMYLPDYQSIIHNTSLVSITRRIQRQAMNVDKSY